MVDGRRLYSVYLPPLYPMMTPYWFSSASFFGFSTSIAKCFQGLFLLMMQVFLSFGLSVWRDPFLSWECRFCFGYLLSSSLVKWSPYRKLCWANVLYMSGSLYFSRRNLLGIWCHHLTFSILRKWHITQTWSFGHQLCIPSKFLCRTGSLWELWRGTQHIYS